MVTYDLDIEGKEDEEEAIRAAEDIMEGRMDWISLFICLISYMH